MIIIIIIIITTTIIIIIVIIIVIMTDDHHHQHHHVGALWSEAHALNSTARPQCDDRLLPMGKASKNMPGELSISPMGYDCSAYLLVRCACVLSVCFPFFTHISTQGDHQCLSLLRGASEDSVELNHCHGFECRLVAEP